MRKIFVHTVAPAALTLVLAACSGGSSSTGSTASARSTAVTAAALSSALGCPRLPGEGKTVQGQTGLSYYCLNSGSGDNITMVYFVIFASQGDEDIWGSQYRADHGTGPNYGQLAVLGPLWAVWGNDQATISKAVNFGGKLV